MVRAFLVGGLTMLGLWALCMAADTSAVGDTQQTSSAEGVQQPDQAAPADPQQGTSTLGGQEDGSQSMVFSAADQVRLGQLQSKKVHELTGHRELAEFVRLRKTVMQGQLPAPAEDITTHALMAIGQPYKRMAFAHDLSEADCVTFVERCIALACTDSWGAAYKLQNRLRFKEGQSGTSNLNQEPILDWIPANGFLLDEVTETLGVPVAEFDAIFEGRTARTTYISKEKLAAAYPRLQTGDIMLVIAEQVNPPSDPELRVRCAHMAIIYKPSEAEPVQILHSYPPAASQWPLARLLRNKHVKGGKFLRLKADARQIVAGEFARLVTTFDVSAADMDNKVRLRKGQFGFLTASRQPDSTVDINGIRYGVIQLQPGETLWSLFKGGWKSVCGMEVNRAFMQRHPDVSASTYQGDTIYYPISRTNGDKTPPTEVSE